MDDDKRNKKIKEQVIKKKIQMANRLKFLSDDMGDDVFDNKWLLNNIVGMSDEEIDEMYKTNPGN